MKRILYASGSVLTGDEIASSVVLYATALARAGTADTVRIPALSDDKFALVELLIGPASQLIVEDALDRSHPDLDQAFFVADLDRRRERLEHPPTIQSTESPTIDLSLEEI